MRRAIDLLPPERKPFFVQYREEIVVRVMDPDLWRNVGWPEAPNRFESFRLVDPLLAADRKAIAGRDSYDETYFAAFFTSVKPLLEQRIGGAIAATASLIVGAWQLAGKPALKLEVSRPVERVRPGPR
jgi:hypothetical protein